MKRLLLLLLLPGLAAGQARQPPRALLWYSYNASVFFTPKHYLGAEVQERHFVHPLVQSLALYYAHYHVMPRPALDLSVGLGYARPRPADPYALNHLLVVPEWRPHLEAALRQPAGRWRFEHRLRAEARFFHESTAAELLPGYRFRNVRVRYRLQALVPLGKLFGKFDTRLRLSDELFLNTGHGANNRRYDQNWAAAGLGADVLKPLTIEVAYLNLYQQRTSGDFFTRHVIRLSAQHRMAFFRQKKVSTPKASD